MRYPPVMWGILLALPVAAVAIEPETPGRVTLGQPSPGWFLLHGMEASYLFDGDTGEMQGLISHNWYTPAIEPNVANGEFYLAESFYSRGVRGERTDVVTIVDLETLSPKSEVVIPAKSAALPHRHHIGLMGNGRHLAVFNMTPAQSISIVDVVDRVFVGEISTPGCAMIMPSGERAFAMICGDGTLQLIVLDDAGKESSRSRSKPFFVVEEDPLFALPVETDSGWLLVTHDGRVFEAAVAGEDFRIGQPWWLTAEADRAERWRPGGSQPLAFNRRNGLLYVLMHQGDVDTHAEPGSEVWVIDVAQRNAIGRLRTDVAATNILASDEARPKLYVYDEDGKLYIHDGLALTLLRTIDEPGPSPSLMLLQGL
ncbi:MAG TPA: amine dehydrogenase large subunit [Woeseiaceae bacterium]|nr:amine dehydrogenase large subunit [Woeseiaceae bacterium]